MLLPHAEADQAAGDAAEPGVPDEQAEKQRRLENRAGAEHAGDHALLNGELETLCQFDRPFAALLDRSLTQRSGAAPRPARCNRSVTSEALQRPASSISLRACAKAVFATGTPA